VPFEQGPPSGGSAEPTRAARKRQAVLAVRRTGRAPQQDVVIVRGTAEDLGTPAQAPDVVAALSAKYAGEDDRRYLPDADPDFDVIYAISPQSAMMCAWPTTRPPSAGGPPEYSMRSRRDAPPATDGADELACSATRLVAG
jgi:hypothetical protein